MTVEGVSIAGLSFDTPELRFGNGTATDLPEVLNSFDITEPLIVTDEQIEAAGLLDEVLAELNDPFQMYYATTEPSTDDFDDLPSGEVDGVVAIGGGSCIDAAKMAAVLIAHSGKAADYIGVGQVHEEIAPLVAIPTTSGTGSQATQTVVLTHEGVKRGVSDEALRPDIATELGVTNAKTPSEGAAAFIKECERLATTIGLPGSFKAIGLDIADLDAMVENTLIQERRLKTNPRTVTEDFENHLKQFLKINNNCIQ